MLRISKLADYSTVIMVFLAQGQALASVTDIANATLISKPTVSKLVKRLVQANLLISERGAKGGYRLARATDNISVADIVYAIEERTGMTECTDAHKQCALQARCQISQHWRVIDNAISSVLKNVSLTSLIRPANILQFKPKLKEKVSE